MTHSTSPQRQVPVLPQSQVHLPWHNHNHIYSNPSSGTATPMKHINSSTSSGTATPVNSFPTAQLHSHSLDALQTHYTMHPQPPSNAYTPQESFEIVSRAGVKKAHMRIEKSFLSACSGGMILSFACATLISTHTSPWYQENAPGLIKTIAALVFPYGLVIVQMTGSDLCTGSFMYTTVAALHRRLSVWRMLQHWGVTFLGNLAGSLFVCCVIVGCEYMSDAESLELTGRNRWWTVRGGSLSGGVTAFCVQETGCAGMASDIPQRHRRQLVGVLGMLSRDVGSRLCIQGGGDMVADVCLRVAGLR